MSPAHAIFAGMTSVEAYMFTLGLIRQPVNGSLTVDLFEMLFNNGQVEHMSSLVGNGVDQSLMGVRALSAFFVDTVTLLTNGRGTMPPPPPPAQSQRMAFGPVLWSSGYAQAVCGSPSTQEAVDIPVEVITAQSWADRSRNMVDGLTTRNPYARIVNGMDIEARPRSLQFVRTWYVRFPRPIVVGTFLDPQGVRRPLEGGPGQVDPEWDDMEVEDICWRVVGYLGLAVQSDRMQATAARKEAANG